MKRETFGFTLIEIVVTVVLMVAVSMVGAVGFSRVRQREEMAATVMQVAQVLTKANGKSKTGTKDAVWKVVLNIDKVSLTNDQGVAGEEYALAERYELISSVSEIEFSRGDGRVIGCESGCVIEIKERGGSLTRQIIVLFSGVVEY